MATVVAEMLGGALGLYLLFGVPIPIGGILTALFTLLICRMDRYGQRTIEWTITGLVSVISLSYVIERFWPHHNGTSSRFTRSCRV